METPLSAASQIAIATLKERAPEAFELAGSFKAAGFHLALVGGTVRDALLNRLGNDLDFTTDAKPEDSKKILKKFADETWDVGIKFGTIGAKRGETTFEVTTYRADSYEADTRKPEVQFGDNIEDDLRRRDFTVNAMAIELTTDTPEFIDPYNGVTDLLKKSMIDIKIPSIFYGVGVSIELKSPDNPHSACIRTPNRGLACGLYTAPYIADDNYPKDHIIVGATNFISEKPYYYGRLASIEGLVKGAIEQINSNFYRADFIKTNIGWRPTSQDTYPLIGKTSINNLIIITGTKREGFHLSPVISEYIVSIIYEEPTDKKMLYFKPERSLIKSLTREEAIQKAVRHQISAAYQHEFKPSRSRMTEQLKKMYRNDIEKVHDQVGALDWGIPPEMIEMYRYGKAAV